MFYESYLMALLTIPNPNFGKKNFRINFLLEHNCMGKRTLLLRHKNGKENDIKNDIRSNKRLILIKNVCFSQIIIL